MPQEPAVSGAGAAGWPAAQLDLRVARRGERSFLSRRLFRAPFVLTRTFHLERRPAHMLNIVTQTSAGALCAGDALAQSIRVDADAAVSIRTQGATAVHRAAVGTTAREHVALHVAAGGHLEFLPEPKILFPGAALRQALHVWCEPGGAAILSDAFLAHDPGGGGQPFHAYASEILIHGGEAGPLVAERVELSGLPLWTGARASFRAFGTLFAILPLAEADLGRLCDAADAACDLEGVYGAASLLPRCSGIVLRLTARDGAGLRKGLQQGWRAVRRAAFGVEPAIRIG